MRDDGWRCEAGRYKNQRNGRITVVNRPLSDENGGMEGYGKERRPSEEQRRNKEKGERSVKNNREEDAEQHGRLSTSKYHRSTLRGQHDENQTY